MEVVENSSTDRAAVERRPSKQRSRVTNNAALLPDIDGRSALARRFKDIASQILVDQGGAARCSESRTQLVRRGRRLFGRADGEPSHQRWRIDIQAHALLCSTLARLGSRIGLGRIAKDITPSLAEYLSRKSDEGAE
jgi:hypothetical protein